MPRPYPCLRFGALALALALSSGAAPSRAETPPTQEGWLKRNFIDPEDGALDASPWLAQGGFLPIPVIISEPAVGGGLGVMLAFIGQGDPATDTPPSTTAIGAIATGNDSKIYAALHMGTYAAGRLKLSGYLAQADVNLDFHSGGSDGTQYNFDGQLANVTGTYRLGQSNWYAGGTLRLQDLNVALKDSDPDPLLPASSTSRMAGLGLILDYNGLDNVFTPTRGTSARISAVRFRDSEDSAVDFTRSALSAFSYFSPNDRVTLGGKLAADHVSGEVPFYLLPAIDLRGIPANRYQGETAVSMELEASYRFAERWRAVGFGGYGWTDDFYAGSEGGQGTYGVGIRYRIARALGIDMGLDVAWGPEDTVVYIQFGRAWQRI